MTTYQLWVNMEFKGHFNLVPELEITNTRIGHIWIPNLGKLNNSQKKKLCLGKTQQKKMATKNS